MTLVKDNFLMTFYVLIWFKITITNIPIILIEHSISDWHWAQFI